jgi:hypothetical protein
MVLRALNIQTNKKTIATAPALTMISTDPANDSPFARSNKPKQTDVNVTKQM